MRRHIRTLLVGLLAASTLSFPGCGGGGTSSGRGTLRVIVHWPTRSRLIPEASNSIVVIVTRADDPTKQLGKATIAKPATTALITEIPALAVQVGATAFPNADGTGIAQASGSVGVTVVEDKDTDVSVTMDSTIDHITLQPGSPTIKVNGSVGILATAYDASGSVVLTAVDKWVWKSNDTSIVTIAPNGASATATGVKEGLTTVVATEQESGKSTSALVTVSATSYKIVDLGILYDAKSNIPKAINDSGTIAGNSQNFTAAPYTGLQLPFTANGSLAALGLGAGAKDGHAYGINSAGDVVGNMNPTVAPNTGNYVPTVWTGGTAYLLSMPSGSTQGTAVGTNDAKEVVATTDGGVVLWAVGPPVVLPTLPGGAAPAAAAISSDGVVLGAAAVNSRLTPYVWIPTLPNGIQGSISQLPVPGDAIHTQPTSINSKRKVAGYYLNASGSTFALLWDIGAASVTTLLPPPNELNCEASGINDGGVVVGICFGNGPDKAVVWVQGQPIILPPLVAGQSASANAINSKGVIAGNAKDSSGVIHAVRWDPL